MLITTLNSLVLTLCLQAPTVTDAAPPHGPAPYTPPYASTPYPAPPPVGPEPYREPAKRSSKFAFAFVPGMSFGGDAESPLTALHATFFFGGKLRGDKVAVGYQLSATPVIPYLLELPMHHHLAFYMHPGKRGFLAFSGGLAMLLYYPTAIEGEIKVGVRFGPGQRGVVGGQFRLGIERYTVSNFPLVPQGGFFFGVSLF